MATDGRLHQPDGVPQVNLALHALEKVLMILEEFASDLLEQTRAFRTVIQKVNDVLEGPDPEDNHGH